MVLVCNTMIDEEIYDLALFGILLGIWSLLKNVKLRRYKLEICPVWGKLEIKFPVGTKETEDHGITPIMQ